MNNDIIGKAFFIKIHPINIKDSIKQKNRNNHFFHSIP